MFGYFYKLPTSPHLILQRVDYCVDKTGFGIRRDATHTVWEYKGPPVPKHSTLKLENLSQVKPLLSQLSISYIPSEPGLACVVISYNVVSL